MEMTLNKKLEAVLHSLECIRLTTDAGIKENELSGRSCFSLNKAATEAITILSEIEGSVGWRSMDSAPNKGVFLVISKYKTVYVAVRTANDYPAKDIYPFHTFSNPAGLHKDDITHWMPLPEPPGGEGE